MKIYFQKLLKQKNNPNYIIDIAKSSSVGTLKYKTLASLYYFYITNQTNLLHLYETVVV